MSERMTAEEWKALLLRARQNPGQWLATVAMEGNRARASEDEKDAEISRLWREPEGTKDPAIRLNAEEFEAVKEVFSKPQKASPALKALLQAEIGKLSDERLCYCTCCCRTPTGYRADDERAECTCKVRAEDLDPKDATIKALADALEAHGARGNTGGPEWHSFHCIENGHDSACDADRAALRLAGRL